MADVDWNKYEGTFEKLPSVNDDVKTLNAEAVVTFEDDGKLIDSATMEKALRNAGKTNQKGRDTFVFKVDAKGAKKSLFVPATGYSNMRELKSIRDANKGTMKGAKAKITRISVNDIKQASLKFEAA